MLSSTKASAIKERLLVRFITAKEIVGKNWKTGTLSISQKSEGIM